MFLRRCFSSKVFSFINFPALITLVPSHLYGLLSFFISTLKKRCKRYFCNLQDDTDNKCFLSEAVFYLRWNIGPVELLNSNFVSAFFLFVQEEIVEDVHLLLQFSCPCGCCLSWWLVVQCTEIRILWCTERHFILLQLVPNRFKDNLNGKVEEKEKAFPTILQAVLQDSFLAITNCKTPTDINRSLACMWLFQVSFNYFIWVK